MEQTKITIIVPTRERADTLYWCLKTLVQQEYDNLFILVSDNYSQDNTKEVVLSFNDKRITYINTGKRLDMSSNWEFALSHVTEGYVGFLGDDDGILLNTISRVDEIIKQTKCLGIRWERISYNWPNRTPEFEKNYFEFKFSSNIYWQNSNRQLKKYLAGKIPYNELLFIYEQGLVDFSIIKKVKDKQGGRFFKSPIPDVYSAIALTYYTEKFINIDYPMGIMGVSSHSTGSSSLTGGDESSAKKFLNEMIIPFHPKVILSTCATAEGDSLLRFYESNNLKVNENFLIKRIIENSAREAGRYPEELKLKFFDSIRKMGALNNENDFTEEQILKNVSNHISKTPERQIGNGINDVYLNCSVNLDNLNISNVFELSCILSSFLGLDSSNKVSLVYWSNTKFLKLILRLKHIINRLPYYLLDKKTF